MQHSDPLAQLDIDSWLGFSAAMELFPARLDGLAAPWPDNLGYQHTLELAQQYDIGGEG